MNNLTLLTYTHSKTIDIHPIYFDRIDKYFNIDKHVVLCDIHLEFPNIVSRTYSNRDEYYKHMIEGLYQVKTNYVIYSQEDYFLYDFVDKYRIENLIKILDRDTDISFIRLINSGIDFLPIAYNEELVYIPTDHNYFFSTQISIWRVTDLIKMFESSKVPTIWDEPKNSIYLKQLGKIGLCVTDKGRKVGGHYDSTIYPYIATAIIKGKWNDSEYSRELTTIYKQYNIDKTLRGVI